MKPARRRAATSAGASSERKKRCLVVLVERHQLRDQARHARVPAQRRVLRPRQLQPRLQLPNSSDAPARPPPIVTWRSAMSSFIVGSCLMSRDQLRSLIAPRRAAGGPQLPAHQPHPAPPGHAVHGLVQQDRATRSSAICRSRVWRLFADPTSTEAAKTAVRQPARLLRPRAQARRAPDRSRSRRAGQPVRRHRRRLRARSTATS